MASATRSILRSISSSSTSSTSSVCYSCRRSISTTRHSAATQSQPLRSFPFAQLVNNQPPLAPAPEQIAPSSKPITLSLKGKGKEILSPSSSSLVTPVPSKLAVGKDGSESNASVVTKKRPSDRLRARKAAITLTPSAVERLRELANPTSSTVPPPSSSPFSSSSASSTTSTPTPTLLRIGVRTKGCAGMGYHLEYVSEPGRWDDIVEQDGVKVLIESKALISIIGSVMEWKEDRLSSKFVFHNPNVKDACGCGESFNVAA